MKRAMPDKGKCRIIVDVTGMSGKEDINRFIVPTLQRGNDKEKRRSARL